MQLSTTPIADSQSLSIHFVETLLLEGIAASIGSVAIAYNNALAESTIGFFKTGAIRDDNPFRNGPLKTMTSSGSRWSVPTGTTESDPLDHRTDPTDRVREQPLR